MGAGAGGGGWVSTAESRREPDLRLCSPGLEMEDPDGLGVGMLSLRREMEMEMKGGMGDGMEKREDKPEQGFD